MTTVDKPATKLPVERRRVLIVKTSSLGDIIHTLPALTDAMRMYPNLEVDWVVEKNFSEPLRWHSGVKNIIEIEFRKWRKTPWQAWRQGHWQTLIKTIRQKHYDIIIDAQGLIKSALITRLAKGKRHGLASQSAREPLAAWLYQQRHRVDWQQHAIERVRALFAHVFNYPIPKTVADYGITDYFKSYATKEAEYIVFLHGTTWDTKLWPLTHWQALGKQLHAAGYQIRLPWGNDSEKQRAEAIAAVCTGQVLPRMTLHDIAIQLFNAKAVVAVDTGLGHLTAALAKPAISLYGASDANKTGAYGKNQYHMSVQYDCAPCLQQTCRWVSAKEEPPCYQTLTANTVMQKLKPLLQPEVIL